MLTFQNACLKSSLSSNVQTNSTFLDINLLHGHYSGQCCIKQIPNKQVPGLNLTHRELENTMHYHLRYDIKWPFVSLSRRILEKNKWNIFTLSRTVALVILQLQSMLSIPVAPEDVNTILSSSVYNKEDSSVFIAKEFNISAFKNDTIETSLRLREANRRRKREINNPVEVLEPGTAYRVAQMNTDGSGVSSKFIKDLWSSVTKAFTSACLGGIHIQNGGKKQLKTSSKIDLAMEFSTGNLCQ